MQNFSISLMTILFRPLYLNTSLLTCKTYFTQSFWFLMDNNHICWIWFWITCDYRSKVVCELCFTLTGTLGSPTHVNWHLSLAGTDKVDLRVSEHWLWVMSQRRSHPSESQTVLGWKIPPLWNDSLSLTVSRQLF